MLRNSLSFIAPSRALSFSEPFLNTLRLFALQTLIHSLNSILGLWAEASQTKVRILMPPCAEGHPLGIVGPIVPGKVPGYGGFTLFAQLAEKCRVIPSEPQLAAHCMPYRCRYVVLA
jgi:hypothetical protein